MRRKHSKLNKITYELSSSITNLFGNNFRIVKFTSRFRTRTEIDRQAWECHCAISCLTTRPPREDTYTRFHDISALSLARRDKVSVVYLRIFLTKVSINERGWMSSTVQTIGLFGRVSNYEIGNDKNTGPDS